MELYNISYCRLTSLTNFSRAYKCSWAEIQLDYSSCVLSHYNIGIYFHIFIHIFNVSISLSLSTSIRVTKRKSFSNLKRSKSRTKICEVLAHFSASEMDSSHNNSCSFQIKLYSLDLQPNFYVCINSDRCLSFAAISNKFNKLSCAFHRNLRVPLPLHHADPLGLCRCEQQKNWKRLGLSPASLTCPTCQPF